MDQNAQDAIALALGEQMQRRTEALALGRSMLQIDALNSNLVAAQRQIEQMMSDAKGADTVADAAGSTVSDAPGRAKRG